MKLATYFALFSIAHGRLRNRQRVSAVEETVEEVAEEDAYDSDDEVIILDEDEQIELKKVSLSDYLHAGYEALQIILGYADMTNDQTYDDWELNIGAGKVHDNFEIEEDFIRDQLDDVKDIEDYQLDSSVWLTDAISANFKTTNDDGLLNVGIQHFLNNIFLSNDEDSDTLEDLAEDIFFVFDENEDAVLEQTEMDEFWTNLGADPTALRDGQAYDIVTDTLQELEEEATNMQTALSTLISAMQDLASTAASEKQTYEDRIEELEDELEQAQNNQ